MPELKNLHIIIAEDDADDGEIIQQSFSDNPGFIKVDLVKNGVELLKYLKNNTAETPDVILTDINMPLLNGIEALNEICSDPQLCKIPAFVYSTSINPVYEAKCMALGIKGFLIKPFRLADFDEIPRRIILIMDQDLKPKD